MLYKVPNFQPLPKVSLSSKTESAATEKMPISETYPLGRPLSFISGTNEVGVLDSCVSGTEDNTPDSMVLEV